MENCYLTELRDTAALPGTDCRTPRHRQWQRTGDGRDGAALPVRPFDVVHIPAGRPQQICNTGSEDLVFLCIGTPRFRMENYRDPEG